ncbi:MAG: hypothetical protein OXH15_00635 [Gammaproteobacteria bacterium]|nr:hypothetical protein [Gammaproteobacteria bacterium]
MHPFIRTPPYRPPAFAPCADPDAPIQLPTDLSAARLADELHAQLTRQVSGRDLRVLRRQARDAFRPVMRHARARRLAGHAVAPFDIRRAEPRRVAPDRPKARRRTGVRRHPGAAARAVKATLRAALTRRP